MKMKHKRSGTSAASVYEGLDVVKFNQMVEGILRTGGAITVGQTRDNSTLMITIYSDGESDKEYFTTTDELDLWIADMLRT